jgi:integrase/recombinase XerD
MKQKIILKNIYDVAEQEYPQISIAEVQKEFENNLKERGLRPATFSFYNNVLEAFYKFIDFKTPICNINKSIIIDYIKYCDYVNVNVTINNGGTTAINYIKINLYYKDSSGNIIRSEWTNDDSDIEPGASQVITKMTENDGWDSVHAEIAEIH